MSVAYIVTKSDIVIIDATPAAINAIAKDAVPVAEHLGKIVQNGDNAKTVSDTVIGILKNTIGGDLTSQVKLVGSLGAGVAIGDAVATLTDPQTDQ